MRWCAREGTPTGKARWRHVPDVEWAEWPTPRLEFLTYWNHDPQQFVWTKTVNDIITKVKPCGL
jgi:hypothetical protein